MCHETSAALIEKIAASLVEDGPSVPLHDREYVAEILQAHAKVVRILVPEQAPLPETDPKDASEISRLRFALSRAEEVLNARDAELAGARAEIELLRRGQEGLLSRIPSAPNYEDNGVGISQILDLMGGEAVFGSLPETAIGVHGLIYEGMPVAALRHLVKTIPGFASEFALRKLLGDRVRRLLDKKGDDQTFCCEDGDQLWRVAGILVQAIRVQTPERAVSWIMAPNPFLNQERPATLMGTPVGTRLVSDLLGRIEYGIPS